MKRKERKEYRILETRFIINKKGKGEGIIQNNQYFKVTQANLQVK